MIRQRLYKSEMYLTRTCLFSVNGNMANKLLRRNIGEVFKLQQLLFFASCSSSSNGECALEGDEGSSFITWLRRNVLWYNISADL